MTGAGDLEAVGRVLGTVDATPLQFWVAVRPGSYLQLDDVVVTTRVLPGGHPVLISGVVTQVRARHEGASFDSALDFLYQVESRRSQNNSGDRAASTSGAWPASGHP